MAPRCVEYKYKKKRSGRPIIKPQTRPTVFTEFLTCHKSLSTMENYSHYAGEEWLGELREKPEVLSPHEYLRKRLQKKRFLPQDLSDDFLSFFLTTSSYNVDLAAEKLEKYFTSRQNPSPLYRDRDPLSPENVNILKKLYVLPMPDTTADGIKVIITGAVEPLISYDQMEHAKALAMVFDLLIWEKDFGFGDYIIVFDGRGFQCPQLLENKVHNHKSIKTLLQDTIPGTLRSFYFLYPPPYVAKSARIRSGLWITVVKTKEDLITYLPVDRLPLEYGGTLGHLGDLLEQWVLHMVQNRDFFIEFEKRMIRDYERKLCYEKEVKGRGKNWVQKMKLVEDEWEYKKRYYENLKCMVPLKHEAYGTQRIAHLRQRIRTCTTPWTPCQLWAREQKDAKAFQGPPSIKEFPTPKRVPTPEEPGHCCIVLPVLELQTLLT